MSTASTDNANVRAALAYLRGDAVEAARQEMKAAVNWSNDEGRVEKVQRMLTPKQLEELNTLHRDEMKEIIGDLDGNEKKAAQALNQIKGAHDGESEDARKTREAANVALLGEANAYGLQVEIDRSRGKIGEKGADATVEMLTTKHAAMGSDVLSGGDEFTAALEDPEVG